MTYYPVTHAAFVWDDLIDFVEMGWLYQGDMWQSYMFKGFHNWARYFRPLGVLGFVVQARLFDGNPMAMHTVSLGLHLLNTALVIALAWRLSPTSRHWTWLLAPASGLFYGLHPMLVEVVTWIGCQFDQLQVLTALSALLAAQLIAQRALRAVVLGGLLFLSLCAKESAVAVPVAITLIDLLACPQASAPFLRRAADTVRRHWPSYLAMALAALGYWLLRRHFMGGTLPPSQEIVGYLTMPASWDRIAYTYFKYWQVIFGIVTELNPLHPLSDYTFGTPPWRVALRCIGALAIAALSLLLLGRRLPATGTAVAIASAALAPVLGLVPVQFDDSLYHERYAVGAISWLAVLGPRLLTEWAPLAKRIRPARAVVAALAAVWLAVAIFNIRTTIPLWSNDVLLWSWTVRQHPNDTFAISNLIAARARYDLTKDALDLAHQTADRKLNCTLCYVNGATLSMQSGNLEVADYFLGQALRSLDADLSELINLPVYYRTAADLELRKGNFQESINLFNESIRLQPVDPRARMMLAEALWRTRQFNLAHKQIALSLDMAPPSFRKEAEATARRIQQLPQQPPSAPSGVNRGPPSR